MKRGIWTYPESAVLGSKIWGIPSEEILFFVIHTWMTTTIYLLCNKFTFKPIFLVGGQGSEERRREYRQLKSQARFGKLILTGLMLLGGLLVMNEGKGTYLGLILLWAMPFALLLWSLAYQFLLKLPLINTLAPILIPTIYLWIIDTLALREGIWKIEDGKKLGICIWEGFDIEEAIFFFITNVMIVFGLVAFDNAVSVLEMFPSVFPDISPIPAPGLLIKGLMLNPDTYDDERIVGLQEAATRLKQKSACFYLASSVVSGRLRIELIFL
jgi:15-cis-phytoene synthase/lycopene beta-cyclase